MKKKDWIKRILMVVKEHKVSAYELSKHTTMSQMGANNILSGASSNPNETSLNLVSDYFKEKYKINPDWLKTGREPKNMVGMADPKFLDQFSEEVRREKLREVVLFINYNREELLKDELFQTWIEREAYRVALNLIKNSSED